jgi:SAM-dependent methyltransferase
MAIVKLKCIAMARRLSRMPRHSLIVALAVCAFALAPCYGQDTFQQEADRLSALLNWHPGSVVAEIGAGGGKLTLAAVRRVSSSGSVYSTEIDPKALEQLRGLAAQEKNVIVVKASETDTNLPPECCDSIFTRLVSHHVTRPAEIDASLFRSLKPGGRLAIIDENPAKGTSIPEGVPQNRLGHGVPQKVLIAELTAAGFEVENIYNDWPSRDAFHDIYCVIFRRTTP